jgi:hypothetical protein
MYIYIYIYAYTYPGLCHGTPTIHIACINYRDLDTYDTHTHTNIQAFVTGPLLVYIYIYIYTYIYIYIYIYIHTYTHVYIYIY